MSGPEENREKTAKTDAVLTPRELRHPPDRVPRPPSTKGGRDVPEPGRPDRDEGGRTGPEAIREEP